MKDKIVLLDFWLNGRDPNGWAWYGFFDDGNGGKHDARTLTKKQINDFQENGDRFYMPVLVNDISNITKEASHFVVWNNDRNQNDGFLLVEESLDTIKSRENVYNLVEGYENPVILDRYLEKCEDDKLLSKRLRNSKIWVGNDKPKCVKLQKRLFELGFEWRYGGKKIIIDFMNYGDMEYLLLSDSHITYSKGKDRFNLDIKKEVKI
jgi:hypothetical protein